MSRILNNSSDSILSVYSPTMRNNLLIKSKPSHGNKRNKLIPLLLVFIIYKNRTHPMIQKIVLMIQKNKYINDISNFLQGLVIRFRSTLKLNDMKSLISQQADQYIVPEISSQSSRSEDKDSAIRSIKDNCITIDKILKYWFGQYSPEKAQKQLWMIASSSVEHLKTVDADITNRFQNILENLASQESEMRRDWCDDINNIYGWKGKMAAIIALDQMSRHIHRYYKTNQNECVAKATTTTTNKIPDQKNLDMLAFHISQQFQSVHQDEISCGMIPFPILIFSLMPYRHASKISTLGYVQLKVEEMSNMQSLDMENMIRRFRRATSRRMAVLQDEARRNGESTIYDPSSTDNHISINGTSRDKENNDEKKNTEQQVTFMDEDILEVLPFTTEMSPASNHLVVKVMIDYLASKGIFPSSTSTEIKQSSKKKNQDTQNQRHIPIVVSLSGGVDSMVIAAVLSFLRDNCGYNQLYIAAVHIDYANRPESDAEAAYVKHYSQDILNLEAIYIRRIGEYTRGVTARDEYEKMSRLIRYDMYKMAIKECLAACSSLDSHLGLHTPIAFHEVGIMLGHHRGDLVENVLSNAHKGSGPLDLSGMTATSVNDGVSIFRPLLPLDKVHVFDYAHKFGVPYFKDTTPHWSTRGKLRNKLIPLLEEIYGDGCLNNLASLAGESDEARDLLNRNVLNSFMEKVSIFPLGVIFETLMFQHQGAYFWKVVLRDMLHSVGLGMFCDNTVASILKRINVENVKQGWLQCRKDYAVYLMEDRRIVILYPKYFPWAKTDHFGSIGTVVTFNQPITIGPWHMLATPIPASTSISDVNTLLEKKAMPSWETLLGGYIEYYVKVAIEKSANDGDDPSTKKIRPLVVVQEYTKASRPLAWKNTDLKVQYTIPLLGNDESSQRLLSTEGKTFGVDWTVCKIVLKINSFTEPCENI